MRSTLALASVPMARAAGLAGLILGLEWARVLALRTPGQQVLTLLIGGVALLLIGVGRSPADLGLGRTRLAERLVGGLALAGVLLLPAAVRWGGGPPLGPALGVAAVAVSIGQEVAYRGALFLALREAAGPAVAIVGTTLLWTLAHALSHPPEFLPAVALAGLLLAAWRWAVNDLVGPIIGHVLADVAL